MDAFAAPSSPDGGTPALSTTPPQPATSSGSRTIPLPLGMARVRTGRPGRMPRAAKASHAPPARRRLRPADACLEPRRHQPLAALHRMLTWTRSQPFFTAVPAANRRGTKGAKFRSNEEANDERVVVSPHLSARSRRVRQLFDSCGRSVPADVYCVDSCGSDYLRAPACVDGHLQCASGIRTDTCPPGTCFMTPTVQCCKSGKPVAGYCDTPTSGPVCRNGSTPPRIDPDGGNACP
jgi:hypothetical protein